MTVHAKDLVHRVQAAGGSLHRNGSRLKMSAMKPLPDELVDELRQAKTELLALLVDDQDPERAAIMEFEGSLSRGDAHRIAGLNPSADKLIEPRSATLVDVPDEWVAGVSQLQTLPALSGWTDQEWRRLQADAAAFLATWGAQAHGLGWAALDLFGCHTSAPSARYDAMGLVLLLHGHSVVAMDDHVARIGIRDGVSQSYQRSQRRESVLVWSVGQ